MMAEVGRKTEDTLREPAAGHKVRRWWKKSGRVVRVLHSLSSVVKLQQHLTHINFIVHSRRIR